ncbi:MAG: SusD/RagB family nutrient-binding outer membrane lipoprotein [Chitinophagia bacterium]
MKRKALYVFALAALIGTGCKKSFLDVNTNPNSLPSATPAFVIANAMNVTSTNMLGLNELGSYWSGQWTQSNGYILATTYFSYVFTNGDFNYWDGFYDNLQDYQYVINGADAASQPYFKGPAKIMKAFVFQHLVDLYGNIPFSDALKGVGSLAPKFDDQKAVYEGLITLIDEGINDINNNAFESAYAGSDIMFKGNRARWIQFANSLKLRILNHQSRIAGRGTYITTEVNKIISSGGGWLTTTDAGINPGYLAAAGQMNPIYNNWGYSETGAKRANNNFPRLTQFLVNSLKATNDTFRLKRFGYANGGENGANPGVSVNAELITNYTGVPFGISSGFLPAGCCALGPSLLVKGEFGRPYILLTAAETLLNLAELEQRFPAITLPGTVQSYYEDGVRQAFRLVGSTTTNANALLTGGVNNCDFAASTDKLAAIAYQKWLALCNFNGVEAWTEYRRTRLPNTPQSVQVVSADRPLRLFYPLTELGSNGTNVNAQGAIDVFKTKIFWDVN